MRITSAQEIQPDSVKDAPQDPWFRDLIDKMNGISRQVVGNINGKLDYLNTVDKIVDVELTEDTPTQIASPLDDGYKIIGIEAIKCDGLTLNSDGRPTRGTYDLSIPDITWKPYETPDGIRKAIVTASYDLEHTYPLLEIGLTTFQDVSNGGEVITWDTAVNSRGSIITHSAGTFTVSEAGQYDIWFNGQFEAQTYTNQALWIETTGAVRNGIVGGPYATTEAYLSCATSLVLAAGATFTCFAYQTNAGTATRKFLGSGAAGLVRVKVARRYNSSVPVGRVRLRFIGAPNDA